MPIISSDITFFQSGASNLGGAISGTVVSSALHGLFDPVTGAEALSGDIEFRCIYVKNTHASLTLYSAMAFIQTNTPSTSSTCDIGIGTAAVSGTEQTIANETAVPSGVTFGAAATYATGYPIGDLAPGQYRAIWIRRTITAGAVAYNNDGITVAVQGDTAA